jgi:putative phage-type endonuclease
VREENKLQGSGAWHNQRCGKATASRTKAIVKRLKNGDDSAERKALKIEILCERLTGDVVDKFVTPAMTRGIEEEPRAKEAYEQKTGRLVKDVGFVDHPSIPFCGASPDGLVDEGLVEIKCPNTTTHIGWVLAGVVPEEHKPQMILQCACTGRKWVDFVSYDSRLPEAQQLFIRRYTPSQEEIDWIEKEVTEFLAEVDQMFDQLTKVEML